MDTLPLDLQIKIAKGASDIVHMEFLSLCGMGPGFVEMFESYDFSSPAYTIRDMRFQMLAKRYRKLKDDCVLFTSILEKLKKRK